MDAAAPEAAEPPEAVNPTTHKVTRRRWKIPTPIIVTIGGIVLSAWLLPAFTRQWDDRQKEHELKAAVIADMTTATAHVLVQSRDRIVGLKAAQGSVPFSEVDDQWALASLQIEAKLRTYFPSEIVRYWRSYSTLVETALVLLTGEYLRANGGDLSKADDWHARRVLVESGLITRASADRFYRAVWGGPNDGNVLATPPGSELSASPGGFPSYRAVKSTLLAIQAAISMKVLEAEAEGYSTTWHDLFRDLVP